MNQGLEQREKAVKGGGEIGGVHVAGRIAKKKEPRNDDTGRHTNTLVDTKHDNAPQSAECGSKAYIHTDVCSHVIPLPLHPSLMTLT